jgi:beta-glucosidase
LAVLKAVAGKGKPVITVFLSGRTVYANDLLNLSDAFVAAWLPGTEGKGIADLLFRRAGSGANLDFHGRLSFAWPGRECANAGGSLAKDKAQLFPRGYGLTYVNTKAIGVLPNNEISGCAEPGGLQIFGRSAQPAASLYVTSMSGPAFDTLVSNEVYGTLSLPVTSPVIRVETTQINTQQDARKVTWLGAARLQARSPSKLNLQSYASKGGALKFDMVVLQAPVRTVTMAMACGVNCEGVIDTTDLFKSLVDKGRRVVKIPLACFAVRGADLSKVDVPFSVSTDGPLSAAFTNIEVVADAGKDADAISCR